MVCRITETCEKTSTQKRIDWRIPKARITLFTLWMSFSLNSEISKGMLKPWNIQLKASPPPDACQQDHRFISGSTKKCGLPVCNLSFSYEGYFYVLKNIIHCHCKSCRRHKWVNSERLPSDWMKSQKIRVGSGKHSNCAVFICLSNHDPMFPHCGLS